MTYSDARRPSISQESVSPSPDPKFCEGEPDNANLSSSSPVIGERGGQHISGYAYSQSSPPPFDQAKRIQTLVDRAAELVDTKGKEAFSEFRQRGSEWFSGDT